LTYWVQGSKMHTRVVRDQGLRGYGSDEGATLNLNAADLYYFRFHCLRYTGSKLLLSPPDYTLLSAISVLNRAVSYRLLINGIKSGERGIFLDFCHTSSLYTPQAIICFGSSRSSARRQRHHRMLRTSSYTPLTARLNAICWPWPFDVIVCLGSQVQVLVNNGDTTVSALSDSVPISLTFSLKLINLCSDELTMNSTSFNSSYTGEN